LSQSLGLPGEISHPRVQEAFQEVIEIVNGAGPALGTLVPNAEAARHWMDQGAQYLAISLEALVAPACRGFLETLRK